MSRWLAATSAARGGARQRQRAERYGQHERSERLWPSRGSRAGKPGGDQRVDQKADQGGRQQPPPQVDRRRDGKRAGLNGEGAVVRPAPASRRPPRRSPLSANPVGHKIPADAAHRRRRRNRRRSARPRRAESRARRIRSASARAGGSRHAVRPPPSERSRLGYRLWRRFCAACRRKVRKGAGSTRSCRRSRGRGRSAPCPDARQ